jgi:hypothetical protein
MKKTLYGVIALPLLMGIGMAQQSWAAQLSDAQMDKVTAGFDFRETDNANTSWTQVSLYAGALTPCAVCFLRISNPALSIESKFGPGAP